MGRIPPPSSACRTQPALDDVNEDRPRKLVHIRDSESVVDALGVRWILERGE